VLLRGADAPPTADPEPSESHEPGWGVLLPPEERAQRELAETGGATSRAEAHREPDPPPEAPPTHQTHPPGSHRGYDADTTAPRSEPGSAGDAGGHAAPASDPEPPPCAQSAVPASTDGGEQPAPAAHDVGTTPPAEEPYPMAGEASQTAQGPEQPYPIAGDATQPAEEGDYPMPDPDPVPVAEAPPPEPEPQHVEEAPAEEAEGG
jgi:hypothetical protein